MHLSLETWKIKGRFSISRFSISQSNVLTVELRDSGLIGRGECEPHEFDVELAQDVLNSIEENRAVIEAGISRQELNDLLPAGPARNAIDCALWDLEAKRTGKRAWEIAGVTLNAPLTTAYTISLSSIQKMALHASNNRKRPLLKLKLGKKESLAIVNAVRQAAPEARLIVDINEAWNIDDLNRLAGPLSDLGVELIEQPLPADEDEQLSIYLGPVPLCADESCLDTNSMSTLNDIYSYVNIKLDKTGGLSEALRLVEAAKNNGFSVMVGCMIGTSLAMAPAMVIGAMAEYCDLDGPLLLERDRIPGLSYENSLIHVPTTDVWG